MNASVRKRVRAVRDYQRATLACRHLYDGARIRDEGKRLESVDDFVLPKLLSARVEKGDDVVRTTRARQLLLLRSLRKPQIECSCVVRLFHPRRERSFVHRPQQTRFITI